MSTRAKASGVLAGLGAVLGLAMGGASPVTAESAAAVAVAIDAGC